MIGELYNIPYSDPPAKILAGAYKLNGEISVEYDYKSRTFCVCVPIIATKNQIPTPPPGYLGYSSINYLEHYFDNRYVIKSLKVLDADSAEEIRLCCEEFFTSLCEFPNQTPPIIFPEKICFAKPYIIAENSDTYGESGFEKYITQEQKLENESKKIEIKYDETIKKMILAERKIVKISSSLSDLNSVPSNREIDLNEIPAGLSNDMLKERLQKQQEKPTHPRIFNLFRSFVSKKQQKEKP